MKKFFYAALMCMISMVFFTACGKDEPEDGSKKMNYDQMIGSWKLTSYSVLWKNLDDNTTEKELNYTDGYLVINKKKTDDGDRKNRFAEISEEYEKAFHERPLGNEFLQAENEIALPFEPKGHTHLFSLFQLFQSRRIGIFLIRIAELFVFILHKEPDDAVHETRILD